MQQQQHLVDHRLHGKFNGQKEEKLRNFREELIFSIL
jgi:hypothetical protein